MAWTYKQEFGRKIIHVFSIFYVIIYLLFFRLYGHRAGLLALTFLLVLFLAFEYFRISLRKKIPLISFFWNYKRTNESNKIGGEVFFLLGAILSLAVFDLRIAIASILMTTFGDFISFFVSDKGKIKMPTKKWKRLEGTIFELLIDIAVGFFIIRTLVEGKIWWLESFSIFGSPIWPVIIVMAVTATLVETFVSDIDDNLLIPVSAGLAGQILIMLI